MPYRFRNNPSKGCRYSLWASRFTTEHGTRPVLEWFRTSEELLQAAAEMDADERFSDMASYCRSQEVADAS